MIRPQRRNATSFRRLCLASAALLGTGACAFPTLAQTVQASKLPIINVVQDYQGVDVNSGGYVSKSPFPMNAPGASHLAIRTSFNGRRFTNSLNAYLTDQTYTYYQGDYTSRELTVEFGGKSRWFACAGVGPCYQMGYQDGATLTRTSMRTLYPVAGEDRYEFRDRDGTLVTFFDPVYEAVPGCYDPDSNCNAAWYSAFAAAASIRYPNGEKLTFDPLAVKEQDGGGYRAAVTVHSNLGYDLKFANTVPSNFTPPTKAGVWWLRQVPSDDDDLKITLTRSGTTVALLRGVRTRANETIPGTYATSVVLKKFEEQDILGRTHTLDFVTYGASWCQLGNFDYTMPVISRDTSPGGVVKDVTYHPEPDWEQYRYRVATVTRAGQTWNYSYNVSGRPGVTSTDPDGGMRTTASTGGISSPLSVPNYECMPYVPMAPTKQTDELNLQTSYAIDMYTREPSEVTYPEGDGYRYERDLRNNIKIAYSKPKTGTPQIIYQGGYETGCANSLTCNSPLWSKDALGNQTDYTYDGTHGGVLTETRPAANGLRLRTFTTYEAYNTGNGVIYREIKTEFCGLTEAQLALTSCPTGAGTEATTSIKVTNYGNTTTAPHTYGGFLPYQVTQTDGNASLTVTTTYTYDAAGRVTALDGPLPGPDDTAYITFDAAGRKVFEISPDPDGAGPMRRIIIKHYYNHDNGETRTETGYGQATDGSDFTVSSYVAMSYDSAGRLIKKISAVP